MPLDTLDASGETTGNVLTVQSDGSVAGQAPTAGDDASLLVDGMAWASSTAITATATGWRSCDILSAIFNDSSEAQFYGGTFLASSLDADGSQTFHVAPANTEYYSIAEAAATDVLTFAWTGTSPAPATGDSIDVWCLSTGVGASGADGAAGAAGAAGTDGTDGAQGPAGAAGTNGTDGTDGAQGPQGVAGAQGAAGTNGTDGAPGAAGAAGTDGNDGTDGTDGAQGAAGSAGADGLGVPSGGATGEVLAKASAADNDTEWVAQTGGAGGLSAVASDSTLDGDGTAINPLGLTDVEVNQLDSVPGLLAETADLSIEIISRTWTDGTDVNAGGFVSHASGNAITVAEAAALTYNVTRAVTNADALLELRGY